MAGKKPALRNQIRTLRFMQDEMTQQALAEAVGVSRQTVNAIENGKYDPSLPLAFKIAEVFGQAIEEIFDATSA